MEKFPLHIKDPELQKSEEVSNAVEKQERLEGEKIPNDPTPRIEAFMDRLENIFLNPDEDTRKRNIEMFRDKIYDSLLVKPENFPESYFELQQRIAREHGQAVEEIPRNIREQMISTAIEDQKVSLDAWIDYLSSDDAVYPTWFKYYVWKNIIKLSQFDKERGEFKKRTDSTVAPYPDIYREPLAEIADIYEKVNEDNQNLKKPEIGEAFSKKFSTLYAELIQKSLAAQIENKETITGQWVKYSRGQREDAEKLFKSLQGKGTGWCTAGRSTAEAQIESGDFYAYYSDDADGNPSQPRLAIRMDKDGRIAEVRGILPRQNVEPVMQEVLDGKLATFGENAEVYRKKSADMARLTAIDNSKNSKISDEDLLWLFSGKIAGFGYDKDPRIKELQKRHGTTETALVLIRGGNQKMILDNIGNFKGLTSEIAMVLIDYDKALALKEIHHGLGSGIFKGLTSEIATMLIEGGHAGALGYSVVAFEKLTPEIAEKLIEQGEFDWASSSGRVFERLTANIAMKLIEHGKGWPVIQNLEKFEGLKADAALAMKLIECGVAGAVIKHSEKFDGLIVDSALAMKIIEHGGKNAGPATSKNVDAVTENLEKFEGLKADAALAYKLIEHGGAFAVGRNLDKFEGLKTDSVLAMKMLESDGSGAQALADDISWGNHFTNLTREVALKLAETQYGSYVLKCPKKFENLELNSELAMKFIKTGHVFDVAFNLKLFDGLNKEVMNALIEKGYKREVLEHRDKFLPE